MSESPPWTRVWDDLVCEGGAETWFELKAPRSGTLVHFLLSQDGVTSRDGFTADLFSTKDVRDGDTDPALEEHYRVFPSKVVADNGIKVLDNAGRWDYSNLDGGPVGGANRLYLRISFDGVSVYAEDKTFALTMTILPTSIHG